MPSPFRCALLVLFLAAPRAWALGQGNHYQVTYDACMAAGTVTAACQEIAMASHNADAREWADLSAHAQMANGQAPCAGADAALARVRQLGGEARAQLLAATSFEASADQKLAAQLAAWAAFGRALHTVQDQCAHRGMPNPQHAWFSDSDLCLGTSLSPDLPAEALSCAKAETEAAFARLTEAQFAAGLEPQHVMAPDTLHSAVQEWPSRNGLCEFLFSSGDWDGVDRGWDGAWVGPALGEELRQGLLGLSGATPEACALPAGTLDLKPPAERVSTTRDGIGCQAIDVLCIGDPTEPIIPPWEKGKAPKKGLSCEAAPGGLLAAAALALLRRRRRSPAPHRRDEGIPSSASAVV